MKNGRFANENAPSAHYIALLLRSILRRPNGAYAESVESDVSRNGKNI